MASYENMHSTGLSRCQRRSQIAMITLLPLLADALTVTTFNILAPVHRSMDVNHRRESEREDWWKPRAEGVANYISQKFSSSDIILLQEWWFDEQFTKVFTEVLGDSFERVAERRPGGEAGKMRADGLCCLIRKNGKLELIKSDKVLTGPQRIAQIIQCRERCSDPGQEGRNVFIANSHLSYPGHEDPVVNDQRQAKEASIILEGLTKASTEWDANDYPGNEYLEIVTGDFNSNSCGLAASLVESLNFVNCASATAEQMLTDIGGQVNLGVTHCDHLGQQVSVDHIFLRLAKRNDEKSSSRYVNLNTASTLRSKQERCAALAMGYLDDKGTRILNVRASNILLEGRSVLSDHRPVTAKVAWPRLASKPSVEVLPDIYMNCTLPLDPLEPAWGIVDPAPWGIMKE